MTTLLCEEVIVSKSKEVKTGFNQAESSEEGCSSKRTVLQKISQSYVTDYFLQLHGADAFSFLLICGLFSGAVDKSYYKPSNNKIISE
jgi:hypothetical protein